MHSIVIAANAVLSVAFMMLLGALLKNRNIIREASFKDFNWVVFHICLPVTLFNNIQGMDPAMFQIRVLSCLRLRLLWRLRLCRCC